MHPVPQHTSILSVLVIAGLPFFSIREAVALHDAGDVFELQLVVVGAVDQTSMTGAKAHDPRQFTISTENMPSSVVSPGWIGYTKLDSFVRAGRVRRSPWRTRSTPGISPTSSSGR